MVSAATEQRPHRKSWPQERQRRLGEKPRRFRRTIPCSPRSKAARRISTVREAKRTRPWSPARAGSRRRSTTSTRRACGRRAGREGQARDAPLPGPALGLHRRSGRAEHQDDPLLTRADPGQSPGVVAGRLPLLVRALVRLVHHDEPSRGSGAKTADLGPTTASTSPRRALSHSDALSPSERPLWSSDTRSPKRASTRRTSRGASAISGTRRIDCFPRSRAASAAPR